MQMKNLHHRLAGENAVSRKVPKQIEFSNRVKLAREIDHRQAHPTSEFAGIFFSSTMM
jgi:hypothetical protein